jgi:hypothetical protein
MCSQAPASSLLHALTSSRAIDTPDIADYRKQPPANNTRRKVVPAKRRLQDVPLEPQRRSSRCDHDEQPAPLCACLPL